MLIDKRCPHCGATMQFEDTMESMFCPFCGGTVTNDVIIYQDIPSSNEPNLYISFNSTDPSVGMVTRIVSTGVKNTYINGQTLSFHLAQGNQLIVLKIGSRNYNRSIVIPPDNSPVRIYASYNGRAHISIDQPPVSGANSGSQVQTNTSWNSNNNTGTPIAQTTANSTNQQGDSSNKGVIGGIIGIVVFVLMARSCLCSGCSSNNTSYNNYETERITTTTTVLETENTLPKRNGFDSNTNIKMSIANYSLEIPSYLKEDLSQRRDDDNIQQFVANTEDENSLARLSCTAIDDPGLEIYTQLLSNKEAFIRSFVKEIDGAKEPNIIYLDTASLGDTDGVFAMINVPIEQDGVVIQTNMNMYFFASNETQQIIWFMFISTDNVQYDYFEDFVAILKSLNEIDT